MESCTHPLCGLFLSTLPARGATPDRRRTEPQRQHFYPRSPRGERLRPSPSPAGPSRFLSTLPARGATAVYPPGGCHPSPFLSTLPARGATGLSRPPSAALPYFYPRSPRGERLAVHVRAGAHGHISIHAPREGSDWTSGAPSSRRSNFYPRSPRGERRDYALPKLRPEDISIHAPREGSDAELPAVPSIKLISIHAPREGSDYGFWVGIAMRK